MPRYLGPFESSCLKRLYLIIGDELASSYNKNNHIYADGFSFKKINIIPG
jgi:hypothetical protein